jgi:hypothetical protein
MDASGQLHIPTALTPGRIARYPLERLGGPQSRSGRYGEKKNLLSVAGNKTGFLGCLELSLVTMSAEVFRCPRGTVRMSDITENKR